MNFFENYNLLILVFLLLPLFLAVLCSYFSAIRNYGSIINKPQWKKTVGAIIGIMFFGIIIAIFIHDCFVLKKYVSIVWMFLFFVIDIVLIVLSRFVPKIDKWIEEKAQTGNRDQNNNQKSKKKNKYSSLETTVNYIEIVLTVFSQFTFAGFIICSIILRIVLLKNNYLNATSIEVTLKYWEVIATGVSIISIVIYLHTIYSSLANPKQMPDDTQLNNVKDRLAE